MNANELEKDLQNYEHVDVDSTNFEQLEEELNAKLEEQMADLRSLEEDREKIGNPDTLGETVLNVIWEQFINQIGTVAGEEFTKENGGLKLDLRDSAHIQTTENFEKGKLAIHNQKSRKQLEHNYKRFKETPHKKFRKEKVKPGMDKVLPRAGELNKQGIKTVTDIYTGRQISTETEFADGRKNPLGAEREHVISSDKVYHNPAIQMGNDDDELANVINDPNNLQGYTSRKRNNDKSNLSEAEMNDADKTKHWEKANKKAKDFIEKKENEGKERLENEGRASQKAEAKRIGGKALRAVLMGLLASLVKDIIRQLVKWFRSGERKLNTFIDAVKDAIHTFLSNMKQHILTAGNVLLTTIATAIIGPLVGMIKKAWIFLKQGYKSVKDAIAFFKDPANKSKPFSLKMMEVGKILIAGLTAGGAILLGEVIEKGLMAIPGFAFEIPILGSLASLLGMFFGALVSGLVGALALNVIDRLIAKKQKEINTIQQIDTGNKILATQDELTQVVVENTKNTIIETGTNIANRHRAASQVAKDYLEQIKANSEAIDRPLPESVEAVDITNQATEEKSEDDRTLDDTFDILNNL
jgi:hypothetical protein